jgi:hypothetical protein
LQGRGSATRDEQIAAVYGASQFESFYLGPDPQTERFTQRIELLQFKSKSDKNDASPFTFISDHA